MDSTKLTSMLAAKDECYARVIGLPGVFATSVGFRYSGGVKTDELAICVHLLKKQPLGALGRASRIPLSIAGFPIDVIEDRPPQLAGDKERPVQGGLEVGGYGIHFGTLGCMVKDTKGVQYILSNEHVLGGVGTATYQPVSIAVCNQLGWVTKAESISSGKMDCAISNLGKYDDGGVATIKGIGAVTGQCQLNGSSAVKKSGAQTHVSGGSVENVGYTVKFNGVDVVDQIRVMSSSNTTAFGEQGDSGAAIVVEQSPGKCQVGGLLWGVGANLAGVNIFGYATPIATVLAKMEVELMVESKLLKSAQAHRDTALTRIGALLNQSRRGQTYWRAFVRNQDALQRLFTDSPRLTVMLKKIPQDALMDTVLKASAEPNSKIPAEIGGMATADVLATFSNALTHCVDDAELRGHIESLSKHITHSVGKSWTDALSDS